MAPLPRCQDIDRPDFLARQDFVPSLALCLPHDRGEKVHESVHSQCAEALHGINMMIILGVVSMHGTASYHEHCTSNVSSLVGIRLSPAAWSSMLRRRECDGACNCGSDAEDGESEDGRDDAHFEELIGLELDAKISASRRIYMILRTLICIQIALNNALILLG